ncbi:MAG TPA: hypothetical protein VGB14_10720 [Acidimicrobiales bacterium]
MRGAHRIRVVALLLAAGMATGGLVGFFLGAGWLATGWPAASPAVSAAVVAAALAADLVARPLDVRRQVPQLWGRIFGPGTVAVLYGARLGVGPLTILTTWLWWAATALAVTHGPWVGAGSGALFHVARTVTMLGVVAGTRTGVDMGRRMAAVRRSERPVRVTVAVLAAGLALAAAVA